MIKRDEKKYIVLDHGTGGLLSQDLVSNVITKTLEDVYLGEMEDSAILNIKNKRIALTTDSFVIDPIFFNNGDIGKIAVCGTVNDLAVSGAKPMYLTLGLILEVGFPIRSLKKILVSIKEAAKEAQVFIVAGDTKVVENGQADKIFINTTGVGVFENNRDPISMKSIKPNDDMIVSGYLGNHSIHILSVREGLGYENIVQSDCAPLNLMIDEVLLKHGNSVHCLRDLTRGGLGSIVNEIAKNIKLDFNIQIDDLPIQYEVKMAADMLGVNPIYLANEGCLCLFCDPKSTQDILATMRDNKYGKNSTVVGRVLKETSGKVVGVDKNNKRKLIEHLYGKELPRLC